MNKIIKRATAIVTALAVFVTTAVFDIPEKPTAQAAVTPTVSVSLGTLKTYTQSGSDKDSIGLSSLTSSSNWSASKSGNTITLKESDKYKTYNVGYVPIIASVIVPANTSYRTTMHFNITGSPNKSSSSSTATAFVELFDLGTSNISSGITFRTPSKDDKNKEQFSDSRTLGRDIRETKDFTSSGSVSVLFENTSSEKTISHYFGFFAGCIYGTKYTHQVEAKCASALISWLTATLFHRRSAIAAPTRGIISTVQGWRTLFLKISFIPMYLLLLLHSMILSQWDYSLTLVVMVV